MGNSLARLKQMVIGNDEVETEATRGFSRLKGSHASVHGDDEASTVGVGGFQHAGLQAVAFVEAMGNVEAGNAAKHFNGCFEQYDGGGAVHVVITIEKHRLASCDGLLQPGNGFVHAQHEQWIVEVSNIGVEEGEGGGGFNNAACHQQLSQYLRKAGGLGQFSGLGRMLFDETPALAGGLPLLILRRTRPAFFSAHRNHQGYSSSS